MEYRLPAFVKAVAAAKATPPVEVMGAEIVTSASVAVLFPIVKVLVLLTAREPLPEITAPSGLPVMV